MDENGTYYTGIRRLDGSVLLLRRLIRHSATGSSTLALMHIDDPGWISWRRVPAARMGSSI